MNVRKKRRTEGTKGSRGIDLCDFLRLFALDSKFRRRFDHNGAKQVAKPVGRRRRRRSATKRISNVREK